jgi:hypothetical protein
VVYMGIDSYYTYINIMSLIRRIADEWGARALSRPKYLESDPSGNSVFTKGIVLDDQASCTIRTPAFCGSTSLGRLSL